jgi:AraC-like DNA-binding protein
VARQGNVHRCGHLGFVPPPHRHDALELNLVTGGQGIYLVDGVRYALGPAHLLFLFPSQEHVLIDTSPDHAAWVLHVRADFVRSVCTTAFSAELTGAQPPRNFVSELPPARARHLERLMRALSEEVIDDAQYNAGLSFALLTCWAEHQRARQLVPAAPAAPVIERAIRHLREHHSEVSLDELARAVGVSRSVLTRMFKAHTGVSVVDYKNRLRLERFLTLRSQRGDRRMLDIALEAGFGSYAQFHRVLSAQMGHAPQALRSKK